MGEKGIVGTYHSDVMISSVACMEYVQGLSNSVGKILLFYASSSSSSSSSSYICQGVGPLVDPFWSHVSRSLFKSLP
jgi:hypothetical protein